MLALVLRDLVVGALHSFVCLQLQDRARALTPQVLALGGMCLLRFCTSCLAVYSCAPSRRRSSCTCLRLPHVHILTRLCCPQLQGAVFCRALDRSRLLQWCVWDSSLCMHDATAIINTLSWLPFTSVQATAAGSGRGIPGFKCWNQCLPLPACMCGFAFGCAVGCPPRVCAVRP